MHNRVDLMVRHFVSFWCLSCVFLAEKTVSLLFSPLGSLSMLAAEDSKEHICKRFILLVSRFFVRDTGINVSKIVTDFQSFNLFTFFILSHAVWLHIFDLGIFSSPSCNPVYSLVHTYTCVWHTMQGVDQCHEFQSKKSHLFMRAIYNNYSTRMHH